MPAVRFSRDKRGYEYVYLVHTPVKRGKAGRTRVLYWYRTPPGLRLGRRPFDEEVQRALERQNPGVTFDWDTIINTPMPPPDMTEYWRERRRQEKALKAERRAAEAEEAQAAVGEAAAIATPAAAAGATPEIEAEALAEGQAGLLAADEADQADEPGSTAGAGEPMETVLGEPEAAGEAGGGTRKRRRRRGGRRRQLDGSGPENPQAPVANASGGTDADPGEPSESEPPPSEES